MTKGELVDAVAEETGLAKSQAEAAVNAVISGVKKGLQADKEVRLVGFGTFSVRYRKARTGINPQTGAKIEIAASTTVGFKPGKALKDAV